MKEKHGRSCHFAAMGHAFLKDLPFTDKKRRGVVKCVKTLKPPRRFCMLFFDILPYTDDASVINGKNSKKNMQNDAAVFGVSRP